ncbi:MAG TPA: trehalose-phosphatase [Sphingomonas sp.]|nr:trehalose-phosphatase [Sphingomonas sp.]
MPAPLPAPPTITDEMTGGPISLFLDFDGTLVDIADRHDAIEVDAEVRRLMAALARRLEGRLAVVSGRPAAEICAYLHAHDSVPPFAIAGSHGLELRWTDGRHEAPLRPTGLDEAVAALRSFAEAWPGVVVEEKPFGAALHYRLAPEAGPACDALADALAQRYGFTLQLGKMVCELRTHGADKGDAVRRFLSEPPMAGTPPLFVGDDLTDEAGFAAAERLGGMGILVGAARETAARYGLPDVAAVHRWLGHLAGLREGEDPA